MYISGLHAQQRGSPGFFKRKKEEEEEARLLRIMMIISARRLYGIYCAEGDIHDGQH